MNEKPQFLLYPREAIGLDTSEPGGESWDPLMYTRRSFQETWIARECTFPIISCRKDLFDMGADTGPRQEWASTCFSSVANFLSCV
jgi:hypothetical protein